MNERRRQTRLFRAIEAGRCGEVRTLLDGGADPNCVDADGAPALQRAVWTRKRSIVKLLLERGADPNAPTKCVGSILCSAAKLPGSAKIIATLVAYGADVNENGESTTLIEASWAGLRANVRELLKNGADPYIKNSEGENALVGACVWRRTRVVEMLLEFGVDPNMSEANGYSALMAAAEKGDAKTCDMLLAHGADANAIDHAGHTALIFAACGGNLHVVEKLARRCASINHQASDGKTALAIAVERKRRRVAALLRRLGAK